MKTTASPLADRIALLNALEKEYADFDGSAAESKDLCARRERAIPSGYVALHGDGSARVFSRNSGCLTPNGSIPKEDAIALAVSHRHQVEIAYSLATKTWFLLSGPVPASPSPASPVPAPVSPSLPALSASPYLTPERDSDPMGVYKFNFADALEARFQACEGFDDDGAAIDAVHAENRAKLEEILHACNSHATLKADVERLTGALSGLLKTGPDCLRPAESGIGEYTESAPVEGCDCRNCVSVRSARSALSLAEVGK
jgi:hypothetical protein